MDLYIEDKVFIVSGGSRGIGEAISRAIADEGGIPMIATRSVDPTKLLIKDLEMKGQRADSFLGDLSEVEVCRRAVEYTLEKYGRIDGIVNNAGVNDGVGLENGNPESFIASVNFNLGHYYYLAHFALPALKQSKGAIVNISSKVALSGQGGTSGYAASKGAQIALTREWAAELLPYEIRVNAILPAEVMTPLYRTWLDKTFENPQEKENEIKAKIPLGNRMTTKEEIAAMAVFLLSPQSAHTTGQLMVVDGGYLHIDRAIT